MTAAIHDAPQRCGLIAVLGALWALSRIIDVRRLFGA